MNIDTDGDGDVDRQQRFVYHGDRIVLQFDKESDGDVMAADLSHRYFWQPDAVNQLMADEHVTDAGTPNNVVLTLNDQQGTVRDLAVHDAETGETTVANHRVFDSFGKLEMQTDAAVDCLFGYTGLPFDKGSGTNRTPTRPYDPSVGQWIQPDWIGFDGRDTNLYRYCSNSPTNFTDPSGTNIADGLKNQLKQLFYIPDDLFTKGIEAAVNSIIEARISQGLLPIEDLKSIKVPVGSACGLPVIAELEVTNIHVDWNVNGYYDVSWRVKGEVPLGDLKVDIKLVHEILKNGEGIIKDGAALLGEVFHRLQNIWSNPGGFIGTRLKEDTLAAGMTITVSLGDKDIGTITRIFASREGTPVQKFCTTEWSLSELKTSLDEAVDQLQNLWQRLKSLDLATLKWLRNLEKGNLNDVLLGLNIKLKSPLSAKYKFEVRFTGKYR